jgi:Predicted membrane protein
MGIFFARAVTSWFTACFVMGISGGLGRLLTPSFASKSSVLLTAALFVMTYLLLTLLNLRTGREDADRWALAASVFAYAMLVSFESQDAFVITGIAGASAIAIIYSERSITPKLSALNPPHRIWVMGAVGIAIFFAVFTGGLTALRYLTYSSPNYDFGIFANMFYNMQTKFAPLVTCERDTLLSHFAVHVSPIYYLILPFYCIFPSPVTLQVAQAVILASGVAPIFLLCRKVKLSDKYGFAFSVIYCLYPALAGGCFYDLHENCFLTPFILWALYYFESRRFAGVYVFGLLTMLVKEDAPVYVAFIAIFMLLSGGDITEKTEPILNVSDAPVLPKLSFFRRNRCKMHGAILLVLSLAYFGGVAYYLNTYGQGVMAYRYSNFLGSGQTGLLDFVRNVLVDPALVFGESFDTTEKIGFLLFMVVPLAFLPFITKKPARFILLLPMLLLNLMTDYKYQYSIWFQYAFGSMSFLFYLAVVNAAELSAKSRRCAVLIAAASSSMMFIGTVWLKSYYLNKYINEYDDNSKITAILEKIPDDVSVKSSTFFVAKLSRRDVIYALDSKHETEYVVLDLRYDQMETQAKYKLLTAEGWTVEAYEEDLIAVLCAPGAAQ